MAETAMPCHESGLNPGRIGFLITVFLLLYNDPACNTVRRRIPVEQFVPESQVTFLLFIRPVQNNKDDGSVRIFPCRKIRSSV